MKIARVSAPMIGEIFQERYRVVAEIGAGGFGTVYRGEQLTTGQAVAIKVLRLAGARDTKAVEKRIARLEREMRLCAQLHHPNIVGLIDFGRIGDGGVYSVFEFVPGKNLEELLADEGALDPQEARHLMIEVLDALSCAHAHGVVHRDLKPSNIMITSTSARRNALVLDFGIGAISADVQGVDHSRLTATNEVVGTIAYAAPEQLLSRPTAPASDLYSWGLVFLECLMGAPAIQGSSLMDMLLKQVGGEVAMPRVLEKHGLGAILRSVVTKKAEDRPAAAVTVLKQLEACSVADLRREDLRRSEIAPASVPDELPASSGERIGPTMQVEVRPSKRPESLLEASPKQAETAAGERRQVTVVCVTLSVGGHVAEGDFEEVDQLLFAGQAKCTSIAARAGGQPAGGLGAQILFRFGFPAAGEDDARRAARASREMVAEIARDRAKLEAERKSHLEIRIAIHTGLTVSQAASAAEAPHLSTGLGLTPHVATRLSTAAAAGDILVSGSTQRLLRHHFWLDAQGTHDGGTVVGPIETYRLGRPLSTARATTLAEGRGPPLVGREHEIDQLLLRWGDVERGRGQVVLLTGEAGIGKSRLLQELSTRLRDTPHRWLDSRCAPEDQNRALSPVTDMLERLLELGEDDAPETRRRKLENLLRTLDFKLDDVLPLLSGVLDIPLDPTPGGEPPRMDRTPQQAKEQLLNALLSLFFELSEREPLILVAEDVHWADPTTLELFSLIVQEAPSARVLAVFSARPTFKPPWSLSGVLQVQLSRLRPEQIEEMVTQLAGTSDAPSGNLIAQIVDRTDGVPLFVEELTRTMLDAGILSGRSGTTPTGLSLMSEVPGTLRDLLTARLDRLGRAKSTAQIAAALGRELGYELLAAVSPLDDAHLREDLDTLVAADLLHRKRRSRGHSYTFKHALIRDTAYESMLRGVRQKVHADIARALEERFPEMAAARPDLLALHCAEAGRKRDAVKNVLHAAESALSRATLAEAIAYAEQGQRWLESLEPGQARAALDLQIQSLLINALFSLKGPGTTEADRHISRAQALLDEVKDSPFAIPVLARLALHFQMRARFAESTELASRGLTLAEQIGDSAAQLSALALLSQNFFATGRYEDARAAAERALGIYDPATHASRAIATAGLDFSAICHGSLAFSLWFLGCPDQALSAAYEGLKRMEQLNHPNSTAMSLLYAASVHRYRRELGPMQGSMARLQEISQRHGLYLAAFAGVVFTCLAGDVETPRQILADFRAFGQVYAMPYWYSLVAEAEAAAGRWDAALGQIEECIQAAESTGEINYLPELLRLKGTFLLRRASADPAAAEACFRRALDLSREQKSRMCELRCATALAPLLASTGRAGEAETMLRAALDSIHEGATLPDLEEGRAALAALHG